MTEFATIALSAIAPSLTNPRKHFNAAKLTELAANIKASGVHQPVLLRPLPAARVPDTERGVEYELVFGERRYRASLEAELATIPAMIRALTDAQVLEIQIIENLQRDDLSELEEAEGYEQLMAHSTLNADEVGSKIGKSRSYVYARLKLLDLSLDCKQALREGRIDSSRALLIARIPDGKLQLKALKFATDAVGYPAEPPSVRRLQKWLKENVMLKLDEAVFKITDARLVEAAGSCSACPKRTGAEPDLFADVKGANICTDPPCFHSKEEAHRAAIMKTAEAKGMRIVEGAEAKEMLGQMWRGVPAGYVDLHEKREELSAEGERVISIAQALGKDAPAPILFIHPRTQAVMELVPSDETQAVLLAKGFINHQAQREEAERDLSKELDILRSKAEVDVESQALKAVHAATQEAIRATTKAQAAKLLSTDVLRAWLFDALDNSYPKEFGESIGYQFAEGMDEQDSIKQHLEGLGETEVLRTVALVLLAQDDSPYKRSPRRFQESFAQALEIDTKAIERTVKAEVKRQYAASIKEVQAKIDAQKANSPPSSAAQQEAGAGGQENPTPKLRARAKKLSEEEATQGIAEAMRDVEAASAAAVAPHEPEGAPGALAVGDQVTVLDTYGQVKRHGKQGKLREHIEAGWWVHFGGKAGSDLIAPEHLRKVA